MNIMYLLFSFTIGGTERLVTDICNEMVKKGENVFLYIVNDSVSDELLKALDKKVQLTLQGRKSGGGNKFSTLFKIAKFVKNNNIDVVHCNSFNAPELLLLSKIVYRKAVLIHTVHGMGQYAKLSKFEVYLRNKICDSFVGISDAVMNDIVMFGADKKKTCRIYNGIKTDKYLLEERRNANMNNIHIGCIARISPRVKGQDILLKAVPILINKYSDIQIEFAGGVAEKEKDEYQKMLQYISDNRLKENVIFLGNVNNVPEYLKSIDICVVPSRSEGFGLALVEAMAMGIPCVASNIAGPAELIKNEGTGVLFDTGDSIDLANKIIQMIDNYQEYKDDAWEKRTKIIEKYSIETMCEQLLTLYQVVREEKYATSKLA